MIGKFFCAAAFAATLAIAAHSSAIAGGAVTTPMNIEYEWVNGYPTQAGYATMRVYAEGNVESLDTGVVNTGDIAVAGLNLLVRFPNGTFAMTGSGGNPAISYNGDNLVSPTSPMDPSASYTLDDGTTVVVNLAYPNVIADYPGARVFSFDIVAGDPGDLQVDTPAAGTSTMPITMITAGVGNLAPQDERIPLLDITFEVVNPVADPLDVTVDVAGMPPILGTDASDLGFFEIEVGSISFVGTPIWLNFPRNVSMILNVGGTESTAALIENLPESLDACLISDIVELSDPDDAFSITTSVTGVSINAGDDLSVTFEVDGTSLSPATYSATYEIQSNAVNAWRTITVTAGLPASANAWTFYE